jgi:hypothetical protein
LKNRNDVNDDATSTVNLTPNSYVPDGSDAGTNASENNEHGQPVAAKLQETGAATVPSGAATPDTVAEYEPAANGCAGTNDTVEVAASNDTDPDTATPSDPRTTTLEPDTDPAATERENVTRTAATNPEPPDTGDVLNTPNGSEPTRTTGSM